MPRIPLVADASKDPKTAELLNQVHKQMGTVPNIVATLAQSSAALEAYLVFSGALGNGTFSNQLKEQIALTVAGVNSCDYCASAHSMLAGMAGVDEAEVTRNLNGEATDEATRAVLTFVSEIVANRGMVEDHVVEAVRAAGYGDREIVEIIANIALNIFTNYFNHIAQTDIDFPIVSASAA